MHAAPVFIPRCDAFGRHALGAADLLAAAPVGERLIELTLTALKAG